MRQWLRFERVKQRSRPWWWPLIVGLTVLGVGGALWQKQSAAAFATRYAAAAKAEAAARPKDPWAQAELKATQGSPAAYERWFTRVLGIETNVIPTDPAVFGISLRTRADFTGSAGPQAFQVQMTRAYKRAQEIESRGLTMSTPLSMTFTAAEFAALPAIDRQFVTKWHPHFAYQAWDYLVWLIEHQVPTLLVLLGLLLFGGNWAGELAGGRAHSRWLQLQGQPLGAQLAVQGGLLFTRLVAIVALPLALTTGVVGGLNGFGSLRLPLDGYVLNRLFDQYTEGFVTTGQVIGQSAGLLLGVVAVMTGVAMGLGVLIRSRWLVAVGTPLLGLLYLVSPPITWLPLTYFKLGEITFGRAAMAIDAPQLTAVTGLLVCAAWAAALALLLLGWRWVDTRRGGTE